VKRRRPFNVNTVDFSAIGLHGTSTSACEPVHHFHDDLNTAEFRWNLDIQRTRRTYFHTVPALAPADANCGDASPIEKIAAKRILCGSRIVDRVAWLAV